MVFFVWLPQLRKIREFVFALKFHSFLLVLYVLPLPDLLCSFSVLLLGSWRQRESFVHWPFIIPGTVPVYHRCSASVCLLKYSGDNVQPHFVLTWAKKEISKNWKQQNYFLKEKNLGYSIKGLVIWTQIFLSSHCTLAVAQLNRSEDLLPVR